MRYFILGLLIIAIFNLASCSNNDTDQSNVPQDHSDQLLEVSSNGKENTIEREAIFGYLSNGIHYILYPTEELKGRTLVSLQMSVGASDNPQGQYGLTHLIEHLVLDEVRMDLNTDLQFSEKNNFVLGYNYNGVTDFDTTTYLFNLPAGQPDIIKRLFAALYAPIANPSFEDAVISRNKKILLAEVQLRNTLQNQENVSFAKFQEPNRPFENYQPKHIITSMEKITKEDIHKFINVNHSPDQAVIVVAGDFNPVEMQRIISSKFDNKTWLSSKLQSAQKKNSSVIFSKYRTFVPEKGGTGLRIVQEINNKPAPNGGAMTESW